MTPAPTPPRGLRLGLLVTDNVMLSSIATASDTLRVAQRLAEIRDPANAPRFESFFFSARGAASATTSTGLSISGFSDPDTPVDILIVPGMMSAGPQQLLARVDTMAPEIELLRHAHLTGTRVAASCSGTMLLGATGLLDGRRATTSWWLATSFRQRFPKVQLEADAMLIDDGGLMTTGAATAMLNLILRLVGEVGGEALALQTGRMLAVDTERQSQAPYVSQALLERPRHSLTERADKFLLKRLHEEVSVESLAAHLGTSERSLLRHFKSHYGVSPLAHIQRLRVERAKALLESTHLSFDEVVERCGYTDVSSFRKLFKRATTLTPGDYRDRFRLRKA